jgi:hypothetical protein
LRKYKGGGTFFKIRLTWFRRTPVLRMQIGLLEDSKVIWLCGFEVRTGASNAAVARGEAVGNKAGACIW